MIISDEEEAFGEILPPSVINNLNELGIGGNILNVIKNSNQNLEQTSLLW